MINLGLLGANISHSRSQEMYESLLGEKVQYHLIDISDDKDVPSLSTLFEKYSLEGLSITYPYKKHFLNDVHFDEQKIKNLKAINCIEKRADQYFATNTDYLAAESLLKDHYLKKYDKFIILGSGNMANVFKTAFLELNISFQDFYRIRDGDLNAIDYQALTDKKTLIINTCSRNFIFKSENSLQCGFWDMNYSFKEHDNLDQYTQQYYDGADLLREQAKYALRFWKMGHLIKNL